MPLLTHDLEQTVPQDICFGRHVQHKLGTGDLQTRHVQILHSEQ